MQKGLSLIKRWINKNNVEDVILFGSSVRGKHKAGDMDLCILIKDEDEKKSIDMVDSLSKLIPHSHINILKLSDFVSGNTLVKTLIEEGSSIKKGKHFSEILGFKSKSIFTYSLKKFSPSKRVRFHYMMMGRNSKGILKETDGKMIGMGMIVVPISKEDLLKEVFEQWEAEYRIERILTG